jgi:hypothetical protein
VWLLGDVFNILGGWLQGILPTMMILAVYYTFADIVLLCQCFYYRGFTWKDPDPAAPAKNASATTEPPTERTALLDDEDRHRQYGPRQQYHLEHHHYHHETDWTNLSPAVPIIHDCPEPVAALTTLQSIVWNVFIIIMVCGAGVAGWALGRRSNSHHHTPITDDTDELSFNVLGQVFGYLCTAAYIGSRLPQLILNYRRRSTDGLSMLFFLFACLGNVTYVLSILAYRGSCSRRGDCHPGEAAHEYGRYILINLSWLAGSSVTLLLDMCVFAQYFVYSSVEEQTEHAGDHLGQGSGVPPPPAIFVRSADEIERVIVPSDDSATEEDDEEEASARRHMRPLLRRGDSTY